MGTQKELDAAEAEVRRLDGVLTKLEAERSAASERIEQIAREPFQTPEQEAAISRRVEDADQEYGRISEQIAEVTDDHGRAQANFEELLYGDDEDDGSGERLDVHQAADIWLANGMDDDHMYGYTEAELRSAAGL